MDILRTKVFPTVDRDVAYRVIQTDIKQGIPVLFSIRDKKQGVSGCQRLSKILASELCASQKNRLSNFDNGLYHPSIESDVETIVKGLGKRFPCDHGWIMSARQPQLFIDFFARNSYPVDQNCFLPGACHVFCFSGWGALALSVQSMSLDDAIMEIENDVAESPFGNESWAFMHFSLDKNDRKRISRMKRSRGAELNNHIECLKQSVQARQLNLEEDGRYAAQKVPLSSVAKKHFKKFGYMWNKRESKKRVTVFDKLTDRGNVIRIVAGAGGADEAIAYVEAKFIGPTFISQAVSIVSVQWVYTVEELEELFARHTEDLLYYEQHIAAIYDEEMGRCNPTITKLIQDHHIRQIE